MKKYSRIPVKANSESLLSTDMFSPRLLPAAGGTVQNQRDTIDCDDMSIVVLCRKSRGADGRTTALPLLTGSPPLVNACERVWGKVGGKATVLMYDE